MLGTPTPDFQSAADNGPARAPRRAMLHTVGFKIKQI